MRARIASLALAAGLTLAAGVIVAIAPTDAEAIDVIRIDGTVGDTIDGRQQTIRVDEVRAAETLDYRGAGTDVDTRTDGVWLVVDLTAVDRLSTRSFRWMILEVGDRIFSVFVDQPGLDMTSFGASAGIPYQGALVFELPADILDGAGSADARLVFRESPDLFAEGVPVVHVDLTALGVESRADISEPSYLSFDDAGLT